MGASGGARPVGGAGRPSRASLGGGGGLMSASSHLDLGRCSWPVLLRDELDRNVTEL